MKNQRYKEIRSLMEDLLKVKAQDLKRSYICSTRGGHTRHAYNLIRDAESDSWRIECSNCKDEGSILENDITNSGMRRSFSELWNFVENMKNKGFKPYFVYLIEIEGKIYIGASEQAWGNRFKDEVTAAFTNKDTKGKQKNGYYYPLSQAIREYTEKIIELRGLKNLNKFDKIQIAMTEIKPLLWQVCNNKDEMFNAEKLWIGATHSQFRELGLNILEGGQGGGKAPRVLNEEILPYFKQLLKLSYNKHLIDGPYQFLLDKLNIIKTQYGYDKDTQITRADIDNTIELLFSWDVTLSDGSIIKQTPSYMDLRRQEQSAKIINYLTQGKDISKLPNELSLSESRIKELLAEVYIVIPVALINALTTGDAESIQKIQEFISDPKNIRDVELYMSKVLISSKKKGETYNINNFRTLDSLYSKIVSIAKALDNIDLNPNHLSQ